MTDIRTIADLTPDPRNARRHTPRNVGLLVDSLQEVGAARSIVIDEAGTILAGNATVEAAGEAGIERVVVVPADGETIVAVQRTGLTAKQKARLALLDNRTAELAEWEPGVLAALAEEGVKLGDLWAADELTALLNGGEPVIPTPQEPREPELRAPVFIEIYCAMADLEAFRPVLDEWCERPGVTVNIS